MGPQVQQQGTRKPHRINAVMSIETAVFHGDESRRQIGRHFLQMQAFAHHRAAMADILAIGIQKGESERPVDSVKVHAGIERRCEQPQQ